MMFVSSRVSFSRKPRCVIHGVPRRIPLGSAEFLSPGMVLRLTTMPTISRMRAGPDHRTCYLAYDRGYIDVDHVAVRAAERDAQPSLLELVRHGPGVSNRLFLQLLELLGLRQEVTASEQNMTAPPCSPGKRRVSFGDGRVGSAHRPADHRGSCG
jgi:hypothetical protein